jgi:hypothetical protein
LATSASPPIPDVMLSRSKRRSGPTAASRTAAKSVLFDQLVGTAEQRQRDREAERLGSLEIDY